MSNIDAATKDITDQWVELADAIAEKQVELKDLKARAKEDGYNLRVLTQIVKEKRKGAKYQAEQLTLELELDTYRKATGLPTELKDAQERAAREAAGIEDALEDALADGEPVH